MPRETLTLRAGGVQLRASLYRPEGAPAAVSSNGSASVLLLHGLRSDQREFGVFPEMLALAGHAALTLDCSGHGESDGRRAFVTAHSHLEDAYAGLDALASSAGGPYVVLGHSFGAHAALRLALADERIAAVVLVAPQHRSGGGLKGPKRLAFHLVGAAARLMGPLAERITLRSKANYAAVFAEDSAMQEAQRLDWDPGITPLATIGYAVKANNVALARRVRVPALVIRCGVDNKVPAANTMRLHQALHPDMAELLELPHAGHSPFLETSRSVLANAISDFMQRRVS